MPRVYAACRGGGSSRAGSLRAWPRTASRPRVRAFGPDGAYVEIPEEAAAALGATGQLSVRANINGVEVHKAMAPRPGGVYRMSLSRAVRAEAGVGPGDEVEIELELDEA